MQNENPIKKLYKVEYRKNSDPIYCEEIEVLEDKKIVLKDKDKENDKSIIYLNSDLTISKETNAYDVLKDAIVSFQYVAPTNYIDFDRVIKLSYIDNDILSNKVIKLSEECGELSSAYLGYSNSKNVSASAGKDKLDVLEESCDVINVAMDIINSLGFTSEEVKMMFDKKLSKWEIKQDRKKDKERGIWHPTKRIYSKK
jgi:hypothetical protein